MTATEQYSELKSYSQNDEQIHILAAFPSLEYDFHQWKWRGEESRPPYRFLDIGAWNAFDKSNTRALYERGWGGVMVEPSPGPFAGLKAEYGNEPRVALIKAAVVLDGSQTSIDLYVTADAVSTTDQAQYEKWKDHAHFDGTITVDAISLDSIFEQYGDFDMVSIDTEGSSVDLLHRLLDLGKRPHCIVVEHDERTTEILATATPLGYACVYANGENLVLIR